MRAIHFLPALAGSCLLGLVASPHAAHSNELTCGSGYHADAAGSCQSDSGEVSRFCPAGQVYHPWMNGGWICEAAEAPNSGVAVYANPRPQKRQAEARQERPQVVTRAAKPAPRRHDAPRSIAVARETPAVAMNPAPQNPAPQPAPPPAPITTHIGGGGGGGGGGWSDRRLKRDIVRLGVSPSGLPIYAFQYVWGGPRYIGVMAQDLLTLRPDAVILDKSGYYRVDYDLIDVKMREEREAA